MTSITLQIDSVQDIGIPEDVMTAANPLDESELQKQVPQVIEADIRVRTTTELDFVQSPAQPVLQLSDACQSSKGDEVRICVGQTLKFP
ncbi:MAG: hypothetical protein J4G06_07355 [Caldilineaceae bacterium]|nr:hypothetical protein [Caldilineaceae bacterium]